MPSNLLDAASCLITKLCPTLCNHVDCSPPGSSVHGIFQAKILEWVAISFSRGSSLTQGLNLPLLHCRQILYHWATREAPSGSKNIEQFKSGLCYFSERFRDPQVPLLARTMSFARIYLNPETSMNGDAAHRVGCDESCEMLIRGNQLGEMHWSVSHSVFLVSFPSRNQRQAQYTSKDDTGKA